MILIKSSVLMKEGKLFLDNYINLEHWLINIWNEVSEYFGPQIKIIFDKLCKIIKYYKRREKKVKIGIEIAWKWNKKENKYCLNWLGFIII